MNKDITHLEGKNNKINLRTKIIGGVVLAGALFTMCAPTPYRTANKSQEYSFEKYNSKEAEQSLKYFLNK